MQLAGPVQAWPATGLFFAVFVHAPRPMRPRCVPPTRSWKGYRSLGAFLAFMALFMGILYAQRQANAAYQVHSTLAGVLVPSQKVMTSAVDLHNWLQGVVEVRGPAGRLHGRTSGACARHHAHARAPPCCTCRTCGKTPHAVTACARSRLSSRSTGALAAARTAAGSWTG